jgi:hypothetical protein
MAKASWLFRAFGDASFDGDAGHTTEGRAGDDAAKYAIALRRYM